MQVLSPVLPSVPHGYPQTPDVSSPKDQSIHQSKQSKGVKDNCRSYGCGITFWGFLICVFLGVFIGVVGDTPIDSPKGQIILVLYFLGIGIGGFMLSIGPILFVVSLIIPKSN